MALVEGTTVDLDQIVKAAHARRAGESLARIAEMAPFVDLTGRFEVFGRDPLRWLNRNGSTSWRKRRHRLA